MGRFEISYEEALRNRKQNKYSHWGYYKKTDFEDTSGLYAGQRLRANKLFEPKLFDAVKLPRDGNFFAMGSCFAREVEYALIQKGVEFLSVPTVFRNEDPNPLSGSSSPANTFVTKYNVFSVLNAFRWAFEDPSPYPQNALIKTSEGTYVDLHSHTTLSDLPLNSAIERRCKVDAYVRRAMEADVVILTFGFCELWWDREIEAYLNIPPNGRIAKTYPGRFTFRLPEFEELVSALDELHGLFAEHGKPGVQIVCTVSPVSLSNTFRKEDVVIANCFSKSLNRVGVEYWKNKYDNVHYFPSYEIVTCSEVATAWKDDRRHPSDEVIASVVKSFEANYFDKVTT
ncbi:GSCFA domain-containing protein [Puniceicoccaceae bacterium K14]|nr:GSCFA domain-containing protein [Puniceicoccaceae bacterium K14]